jgi:hypothetical protein
MASREKYTPKIQEEREVFPFDTAEEAWFWFIQAQEALSQGARIAAGQGLLPRPCQPVDILKVLDRLYRHRLLLRDHLLVLRHYGRRLLAPDPRRVKEARAHGLWTEAFIHLATALERKGIVSPRLQPGPDWHAHALVLNGGGLQ